MLNKLLRLPNVISCSGISRSTLYEWISQGLWTPPVSLGPRSVAWPEREVSALNGARIAGKKPAEIRALVAQLEEARKEAA
ncbi:MAG: AlpA family phage regulatory protein [Proteobacteria bacterium]|nr:AlpA family phage regulatory protein [Pseudomonadota bacterium]